MTRITYTEDAAQDLEEIYRHIAQDNPVAAERHRKRLKQRCKGLLHQPRIGRKRDEVRTEYRSVTEGDYVIFYQMISEHELAIMRVFHAKRDIKKLFEIS